MKKLYMLCIAIISINIASACPSPSCLLDWNCIVDSNCEFYQYCNPILHICQAKEGFCNTNKDCKFGICDQNTHKCIIKNETYNTNKNMQLEIFDLVELIEILYRNTLATNLNFILKVMKIVILEMKINNEELLQCLNQSDTNVCIKNLAANYAKKNYIKAITTCSYFKDKDVDEYSFCINGVAAEVAKYNEIAAENICNNETDPSYVIHCMTQISAIIAKNNLSKGMALCENKGAREICRTLILKVFADDIEKGKEICNNNTGCLIHLASAVKMNKEESLSICKNLSGTCDVYDCKSLCISQISYKFYNESRVYEICNLSDLNLKKECLKNAGSASNDLKKIKEICNHLEFGKDECLAYAIIHASINNNVEDVINACENITSDFKITCLFESGINVGKINKEKGVLICNHLKNISEGHGNWCLNSI